MHTRLGLVSKSATIWITYILLATKQIEESVVAETTTVEEPLEMDISLLIDKIKHPIHGITKQ